MTPETQEILGRECKHVTYVRANDGSAHDLLAVKEVVHYKDGRLVPKMRYIRDYKRPFWITLPNFQNHKDKKEWEDISRLRMFKSTQVMLTKNICRALERTPGKFSSLRMICRNPYVYGCDVTTPVLAKRHYMDTWPEATSANRVACLDIESDMIHGHHKVIMGSLTMKDQVKLIVTKDFLSQIHAPETKLREKFTYYLGKYEKERGIKLEIQFVKTPGEVASELLKTAHAWMPDILAIWNMNYDIPELIKVLEEEGFNLADVFSDPSCHPKFKHFRYIEGASQKVTQSGKVMPLHPADRWHTAECPASFYILDAMCVYKKIRIAKGNEPGYGLDAVLERNLGIRKLKFTEADHLKGGAWHVFMQKNYPIEYCIYNLFDCISMELLDEKTTDLSRKITAFCEHSEYNRFPSQPRRTCDDLHFFCLKDKKVIATTSDKMQDDLDGELVSLRGWITTLPSHLIFDDGVKALKELPDVSSNTRAHVADLDVAGTYPTEQLILNISKETTLMEVCKIRGISEAKRRAFGINLTGGYVNAVEMCCSMFGAPTFDTLLNDFNKSLNSRRPQVDLPNEPSTNMTQAPSIDEDSLAQISVWGEDYAIDADEEENDSVL